MPLLDPAGDLVAGALDRLLPGVLTGRGGRDLLLAMELEDQNQRVG